VREVDAGVIDIRSHLEVKRSVAMPVIKAEKSTTPAAGHVRRPLQPLLHPENIAVIGATETPGSVGRTLLWNLISSPFGGTVFPVNLKRPSVLGIKAYPTIRDVPAAVDLAIICTPAQTVPDLVEQCGMAGIPGAIIISAGFKELGAPGVALEQQIAVHARRYSMRIIGPNCLGVQNPLIGLNASFAHGIARPGSIAFLSQSGALLTAILDWSLREQIGFSSFVSLGSMLDVGFGDLIDHLGDDPRTRAILIYMESIGNPRQFISAAREVALTKPIIVIKAGRTAAAAAAAASHTGSMTGSDEVLDAVFRRVGVQRVNEISELFDLAEVLANQSRPKGPNLTILTNAGGPGVLATDALIQGGGELTKLSEPAMKELNTLLPAPWSHGNPVDILGDASPERYAKSLEIASRDANANGMLVILTPQDMTDPTRSAEALIAAAKAQSKPVLASWMGGPMVRAGEEILNRAGIPTFAYPDAAARAFNYLWQYERTLKALYQTPRSAADQSLDSHSRVSIESIFAEAQAENRTTLTEPESKRLLEAYGIPVAATHIATTAAEAVAAAEKIGFPVVVKVYSKTISHKTDVGGVHLNLTSAAGVKQAFEKIQASVTAKARADQFQGVTVQPMVRLTDAYELILGSTVDAQFGPVLLFGAGGQMVELFRDRALGLPPLNSTLARQMINRTKISSALAGIRGRAPIDVAELERILVQFSTLVIENPRIREIDINPLLVSPKQFIALDARVILYPADVADADLPRPAIRPYPAQYVHTIVTDDGRSLLLRPIMPQDEPLMVRFHHSLSNETVRNRFNIVMKLEDRISHERLIRVCMNDYDREIALVAQNTRPDGTHEIVGVSRLSKIRGTHEAEAAVIVSDDWQKRGIGTALLEEAIKIARIEGVARVFASALPENMEIQHLLANKLGFKVTSDVQSPTIHFELNLAGV
jgi:acetyltransferase